MRAEQLKHFIRTSDNTNNNMTSLTHTTTLRTHPTGTPTRSLANTTATGGNS